MRYAYLDLTMRIWTPPQRQEADPEWGPTGKSPAVVYPASEVGSLKSRADMESASQVRQTIQSAA